jgi:hypothetical protein
MKSRRRGYLSRRNMKNITRNVLVDGLRPILFDRYGGSNEEQLPPEQKVYLDPEDNKTLVFPAANISSFLSSQLTESAPQRIMRKKWKTIAKAALSFVDIEPLYIPFLRDGKRMTLANSGCYITHYKANVKKGQLVIPHPVDRPALPVPWSLNFKLTLFENPDLTENILKRLFVEGGIAIGWGSYRGVYGKFQVSAWE